MAWTCPERTCTNRSEKAKRRTRRLRGGQKTTWLKVVVKEWCRGVVAKRAGSKQKDSDLESHTCHSKNAIGEEGNGKPPHKPCDLT